MKKLDDEIGDLGEALIGVGLVGGQDGRLRGVAMRTNLLVGDAEMARRVVTPPVTAIDEGAVKVDDGLARAVVDGKRDLDRFSARNRSGVS